jgi:hypothetical protein
MRERGDVGEFEISDGNPIGGKRGDKLKFQVRWELISSRNTCSLGLAQLVRFLVVELTNSYSNPRFGMSVIFYD